MDSDLVSGRDPGLHRDYLRPAPEPRSVTISSAEAAARVGISYRQLDFWIAQGLVGGTSPGSGRQCRFTPGDVARLASMARLVNAGLRVRRAAQLAPELMAEGRAQLGPGLWIVEQ